MCSLSDIQCQCAFMRLKLNAIETEFFWLYHQSRPDGDRQNSIKTALFPYLLLFATSMFCLTTNLMMTHSSSVAIKCFSTFAEHTNVILVKLACRILRPSPTLVSTIGYCNSALLGLLSSTLQ